MRKPKKPSMMLSNVRLILNKLPTTIILAEQVQQLECNWYDINQRGTTLTREVQRIMCTSADIYV